MIKKICITFSLLTPIMLACCTSNTPRENINNKTVGHVRLPPIFSNVCHRYTGFTIFNNEQGQKALSMEFYTDINKSIELGVNKSGNNYVDLGEIDIWAENTYYTRSDWDHSITMTDKGRAFIKESAVNNKIDYVIIPYVPDDIVKDNCLVNIETGINIEPNIFGISKKKSRTSM